VKRPHLAASLFVLLFPGQKAFTAEGAGQSSPERGGATAECSIQISSVTVDPKEEHASQGSYLTTVNVQLSVAGRIPPGAVATVGVLTY
jgi:hypothetical protein